MTLLRSRSTRFLVTSTLLAVSAGVVLLAAYLLLTRWYEQQAVQTLIGTLSIEDDKLFEAKLDAAIRDVKKYHGGRAAVEPLIDAVGGHDKDVMSWRARAALIQLRDVSVEPVIRTLATTTRDVERRLGAAWTLGWLRDKKALPVLVRALNDDEARVRRQATWAIAGYAPDSKIALPRLRELAHDGDELQRSHAAFALSMLGADAQEAISDLITLLKDSNSHARSFAAGALGQIGSAAKDAVPTLIELLVDEEVLVQTSAIQALGEIGPDASAGLPDLIACSKREEFEIRVYAVDAIRKIDPDTATRLGLD
jgi:hypothetical protein